MKEIIEKTIKFHRSPLSKKTNQKFTKFQAALDFSWKKLKEMPAKIDIKIRRAGKRDFAGESICSGFQGEMNKDQKACFIRVLGKTVKEVESYLYKIFSDNSLTNAMLKSRENLILSLFISMR